MNLKDDNMRHKFIVLHFGGQCPWHSWMIKQAQKAADVINGTLEVIDVMNHPEAALHYRQYFPFMTVINDSLRLPSPISSDELVEIAGEGLISKSTVQHIQRRKAWTNKIEPLFETNIQDTCSLCINKSDSEGCRAKYEWANKLKNKVQKGILGFIAYKDNKTVAVAEFLPSALIPYPIPVKQPTIAFITCIYSLEDEHDYREQVLDHLIKYLPQLNFAKLQVIAGRRSAYPNGPVSFFSSSGFKELCKLDKVVLREGEEDLILMERKL